MELRCDFNQGYNFDDAVRVIERIAEYGVLEVEQPFPWWDMEGMAKLKKVSKIPIMIDEGVHNPRQALQACETDACDIINIKLMKCGGIYPALEICNIAEKYGKKCIVGCMSESKVAISAGAAVVSSRKDNMLVADLDSFLSLIDDGTGVSDGFVSEKNILYLSDKSGLGIN